MNDTARPLQVALIGYGFVGKAFHAPLINAVPGLELSVVASRDAAKVHADLPYAQVIADPAGGYPPAGGGFGGDRVAERYPCAAGAGRAGSGQARGGG
jgi:predicted dehydrogenase